MSETAKTKIRKFVCGHPGCTFEGGRAEREKHWQSNPSHRQTGRVSKRTPRAMTGGYEASLAALMEAINKDIADTKAKLKTLEKQKAKLKKIM